MLFRSGFTFLDLIGGILGVCVSLYILLEFYKDVKRGERKTLFDTDWITRENANFWFALLFDLFVGLFLLYVIFMTGGFYFGRTMMVLLGYGIANFGISKAMDSEGDDEDRNTGCFSLGCGLILVILAVAFAISFSEFIEYVGDFLDD